MTRKTKLFKIIKYIDYIYINNYVFNSLKYITIDDKINEWKIFSTHFNVKKSDLQYNILHLVQSIVNQNEFDYEIFLISIYIYKKICIEYAHLIDNYVYLFGSIYIALNKKMCDEFLSNNFLSNIFNIKHVIVDNMIMCIEKFINTNNIYFGIDEKIKIIDEIYYS